MEAACSVALDISDSGVVENQVVLMASCDDLMLLVTCLYYDHDNEATSKCVCWFRGLYATVNILGAEKGITDSEFMRSHHTVTDLIRAAAGYLFTETCYSQL